MDSRTDIVRLKRQRHTALIIERASKLRPRRTDPEHRLRGVFFFVAASAQNTLAYQVDRDHSPQVELRTKRMGVT